MRKNAASRKPVNSRSRLLALALAAAMTSSIVLAGTTGAVPLVGHDGMIHACYRVKGKPKGSLRVVPNGRAHCRRGERKVAWTVAGAVGPSGVEGARGAQGGQGGSGQGAQGASGSTLTEQVDSLTERVKSLEGTLAGVTNGDLTGMLATLKGLNNEGLTNAVNSLPAIESLCTQSSALTEQVNLLRNVVGGLGLEGVLGGLLKIPTLPNELKPFTCPTS